jgi:uncharacterized protein YdhG (YjbR/CyaY superfamily)
MADALTPDAYIAALDPRPRAALERLREVIRDAAPADATEGIYYRIPSFRAYGRWLVSYAAFRDHYSLFPLGSAAIESIRDEIGERQVSAGTIHFSYDEELPEALVRRIVGVCVARNATKAAGKGAPSGG